MKISIDTKEDSDSELRSIMEMLQKLLSNRGNYSNGSYSGYPNTENNVRNIFADQPSSTQSNIDQNSNPTSNSGNIFSMFDDSTQNNSNNLNQDLQNIPSTQIYGKEDEDDENKFKDVNIEFY